MGPSRDARGAKFAIGSKRNLSPWRILSFMERVRGSEKVVKWEICHWVIEMAMLRDHYRQSCVSSDDLIYVFLKRVIWLTVSWYNERALGRNLLGFNMWVKKNTCAVQARDKIHARLSCIWLYSTSFPFSFFFLFCFSNIGCCSEKSPYVFKFN